MLKKTAPLWVLQALLHLATSANEDIFKKFYQNDYEVRDWRMTSTGYNKDLFWEYTIKTFRYNKTTRACNTTIHSKISFGEHDIKGYVQVYKRYGTRYLEFPIYLEMEMCQLATNDIAGVGKYSCGKLECPYRKNVSHHSCNWTPDFSHLPPLIPEGEYLLKLNFSYQNQYAFSFECYGNVYRKVKIL